MKSFDLNLAEDHPVCTRTGLKARILCTDRKDMIYPIVALVCEPYNLEKVCEYTKDGRFVSGTCAHPLDLMMDDEVCA